MVQLLGRVIQIYQVFIVLIFLAQCLLWAAIPPVSPHQSVYFRDLNPRRRVQIYKGPLLRIHIGVPQNELIILEVRHIRLCQLIPSLCPRPNAFGIEPTFVLLQLREEARSHLEVWTPRVQKLKCLEQTPPVAPHYKRCNDEAGTILSPHRLYHYTLVVVHSLLHEAVDLFWDLLC